MVVCFDSAPLPNPPPSGGRGLRGTGGRGLRGTRLGGGRVAAEDVDGGVGAEGLAEFGAFAGQGDEEAARAGAGQRRGDPGGAAAIGVGLDHGGGLDLGSSEGVEGAPVGGDGVQIDGEIAAQRHEKSRS